MNCTEIGRILSEAPFPELPPDVRAAVAEHVRWCYLCRNKWGMDDQSGMLHRVLSELARRRSLMDSVMARIRAAQTQEQRNGTGNGSGQPSSLGAESVGA